MGPLFFSFILFFPFPPFLLLLLVLMQSIEIGSFIDVIAKRAELCKFFKWIFVASRWDSFVLLSGCCAT